MKSVRYKVEDIYRFVNYIEYHEYYAEIFCDDGEMLVFEWDGLHDVSFSEAVEWLESQGINPIDAEIHATDFEQYFKIEEQCKYVPQ